MSTHDAPAAASAAAPAAAGAALAGSVWRRGRFWLALVAVLVVAGVVIGASTGSTDRPLDPNSTAADGSRALDHVLAGYGARLIALNSVDAAVDARSGTLVVLDPDAYSGAQLRRLVAAAPHTVLISPGTESLHAVTTIEPDEDGTADPDPDCALPAAAAAGSLDVPSDARTYTGPSCYGGLLAHAGRVIALGSAQVLQNDHLAGDGVAALDVNLLTADRTVTAVTWLAAGPDAAGSGGASVWDLFPDGVYRAFVWLLLVGILLVIWRARRLGPPVPESLPVVVRAAELVEGHGRLYRRAGACDRAGAALRAATLARLIGRLGLPRGSSPLQVGAAAAPASGWTPAEVHQVLAGAVPSDDAALVALARALDALEAAVRQGAPGRTDGG